MPDDLRSRYAEAIAAKFTEPIYCSDKWGENEWVENPEPADRVDQAPRIVFTAGDGYPAFRMPTCTEVAEVVAAARDEELETLRAGHARARAIHPSLAEADAAENALCPECLAPAPCRTRRALDGEDGP